MLDDCARNATFPMLDNGYVYLAATRLSGFRSDKDWLLTIEVFGYSPRAGLPDIHVYSFGSNLYDRKTVDDYVSVQAYENYLALNPHNESTFFWPIGDGDWIDPESDVLIAADARTIELRGETIDLPAPELYPARGVDLDEAPRVCVYELCRYLADVDRERVLCTDPELRASVRPEMSQILRLDEWHHPDLVTGQLPSEPETFRGLARALETGDPSAYSSDETPNTHWRNWPEGGLL